MLLKTPTSNLGTNGGSQHPDKRKEGGHGPTLADEIEHLLPTSRRDELLPTPSASNPNDGEDIEQWQARHDLHASKEENATRSGLPLSIAARRLLPTPRTTDSHGIGLHGNGGQDLRTTIAYLNDEDGLLPTPTVGNITGGNKRRGGERSDELLLPGVADEVEETGTWGPYQHRIELWERVTGHPAPPPTRPDGRAGAHRMNAELPEWMMGYAPGYLTDVPGITRAQALKAAGNGVVPQQAALAAIEVLGSWT